MTQHTRAVLAGGVIAGLIGFFTVAILMALVNVIGGRSPLYTAMVLGNAIFYGVRDPAEVIYTIQRAAAYNGAHMVAFVSLGMLASWFASLGERYPVTQYLCFSVFVLLAMHLFLAVVAFALPILGWGAAWPMGVVSILAAGAMWTYLVLAHPKLWKELQTIPWGTGETEAGVEQVEEAILTEQEVADLASHYSHLDPEEARRLVMSHRLLARELQRASASLHAAGS